MKSLVLIFLIGLGLGQKYDANTGMVLDDDPCKSERFLELDRQFSGNEFELWSDSEKDEWRILSRKCREFSRNQNIKHLSQNFIMVDGVKYIKAESDKLVKNNNVCEKAMKDANSFESPFWYLGGIMYYFGVPAYIISKPKPNQAILSNMVLEEKLVYEECYIDAAKNLRAKRMLLGCAGFLPFVILMSSI